MQHFGVKVSIVEHGFFKAEEVNSDIIEKHLFKLWNRLIPEIRDSYGEKYLVECKQKKDCMKAQGGYYKHIQIAVKTTKPSSFQCCLGIGRKAMGAETQMFLLNISV